MLYCPGDPVLSFSSTYALPLILVFPGSCQPEIAHQVHYVTDHLVLNTRGGSKSWAETLLPLRTQVYIFP